MSFTFSGHELGLFFLIRIIVPVDGYLSKVQALCKKHNVLLICDEIQTVCPGSSVSYPNSNWHTGSLSHREDARLRIREHPTRHGAAR